MGIMASGGSSSGWCCTVIDGITGHKCLATSLHHFTSSDENGDDDANRAHYYAHFGGALPPLFFFRFQHSSANSLTHSYCDSIKTFSSRWSLSCTLSLSLTTFYCDSNLLCHTDRQTVPHLVVPCMQSEQFVLFFLFPPTVCTHKTTTESSSSLSSSSVLSGRWTHFTLRALAALKLHSAGDDGVVVVVVIVLAQGESDVGSFSSEFVSINQRSAPLLLCSRNTGTCKSSTGTVSH